jgi:hypothetical protein
MQSTGFLLPRRVSLGAGAYECNDGWLHVLGLDTADLF